MLSMAFECFKMEPRLPPIGYMMLYLPVMGLRCCRLARSKGLESTSAGLFSVRGAVSVLSSTNFFSAAPRDVELLKRQLQARGNLHRHEIAMYTLYTV